MAEKKGIVKGEWKGANRSIEVNLPISSFCINDISAIQSEEQYLEYLSLADQMFNQPPLPDSPDGIKLKVLLQMISDYENLNYPIQKPDSR